MDQKLARLMASGEATHRTEGKRVAASNIKLVASSSKPPQKGPEKPKKPKVVRGRATITSPKSQPNLKNGTNNDVSSSISEDESQN